LETTAPPVLGKEKVYGRRAGILLFQADAGFFMAGITTWQSPCRVLVTCLARTWTSGLRVNGTNFSQVPV